MPESTTHPAAAAKATTEPGQAVGQPDYRASTARARGLQQAIDNSPRQVTQRQAAMPLATRLSHATPAATAPVQRKIARADWDGLIEPNLSDSVGAQLTGGTVSGVRRKDGELKKKVGREPLQPIGDIDDLLDKHDWDHKLVHVTGGGKDTNLNPIDFSTPAALDSSGDFAAPKVAMNVEELQGDRHAFVHHSYSTYSTPGKKATDPRLRREGGHHLTVENAHLLAMLTLKGDETLGHIDKTKLKKPDVDTNLGAHGVTNLDNLNFFPRTASQQSKALGLDPATLPTAKLEEKGADIAAEAVDERLSLAGYLAFIQTSLASLDSVPAVYGAKILHTAQVMQTQTGLNPSELFLKVARNDQRHLVRAVLTIAHKGLAEGFALPAETLALFKHYVTNTPKLPAATPITAETEWVASGATMADGTTYNALESRYVAAQYDTIIAAMEQYVAAAAAD